MCECVEYEDGDLYLCPVDADIYRELVKRDATLSTPASAVEPCQVCGGVCVEHPTCMSNAHLSVSKHHCKEPAMFCLEHSGREGIGVPTPAVEAPKRCGGKPGEPWCGKVLPGMVLHVPGTSPCAPCSGCPDCAPLPPPVCDEVSHRTVEERVERCRSHDFDPDYCVAHKASVWRCVRLLFDRFEVRGRELEAAKAEAAAWKADCEAVSTARDTFEHAYGTAHSELAVLKLDPVRVRAELLEKQLDAAESELAVLREEMSNLQERHDFLAGNQHFADEVKKLREELAASRPEAAPSGERSNSCNRHEDCNKANTEARAKGMTSTDHCHDEDCEDCFGK